MLNHIFCGTSEDSGKKLVEKKRRMLIVHNSSIAYAFMQNLFCNEFNFEKAKDGNAAMIRLGH